METEFDNVVLDLNDYKRKQKSVVEMLLEIEGQISEGVTDFGTGEPERKAA